MSETTDPTRTEASVIDQQVRIYGALEDVLTAEKDTFGLPLIGPVDWGRVDYPASQLFIQTGDYQGNGRYRHDAWTILTWRRSRETDYIEDVLGPTSRVVKRGMRDLGETDGVVGWIPSRIDNFSGEAPGSSPNENASVVAVGIEWQIETLIEPANTADV